MSTFALEELHRRLERTRFLIGEWRSAANLPENQQHAGSLAANIRGLEKLRKRLEDEIAELSSEAKPLGGEGPHSSQERAEILRKKTREGIE